MARGDTASVEPIIGEAAAVADLGEVRALLVADVHAGIEAGLRYERGVELDSRADTRRDQLCALIDETAAERLVVLGDLAHRIGQPQGEERSELATLIRAITDRVPMTLVEGNHDSGVAAAFSETIDVIGPAGGLLAPDGTLADPSSTTGDDDSRVGCQPSVGVLHGHTWPNPALLGADIVCMGHEHPQVRLADTVGGSRVERAWLRGSIDPSSFIEEPRTDAAAVDQSTLPELVVFPAFNERSGGTWTNVDDHGFLAPFLPDALADADAYLLDGTRLGAFQEV